MDDKKTEKNTENNKHLKNDSPFVFISHDTRDALIAEAFSKLLKSVTAGMLKTFRSSDNKGTQGIEFGVEWYPKIIENLQTSSDVVCILTELSIDKPWILFEAGIAKGFINKTILGVAIGIPLSSANLGPFAQFQNCDDSIPSLVKLVKQLVEKLPNSEPDEEIIKQQVEKFCDEIKKILLEQKKENAKVEEKKPIDLNESAKLFEEVKLMFKELPSRIENVSVKNSEKGYRRTLHPGMIEELLHFSLSRDFNPKITFQILLSPLKQDFPWLFESGVALVERIGKVNRIVTTKSYRDFIELLNFTFENPMYRDIYRDEYEFRYFREIPYLIERYIQEIEYRIINRDEEIQNIKTVRQSKIATKNKE